MNARATTQADLTRTLSFFAENARKPVLADVIRFARQEWPHLTQSAHVLFGLTPFDSVEFSLERARRELARDDNRRAAKHWSVDLNRSIAIRQFIAVLEKFERERRIRDFRKQGAA